MTIDESLAWEALLQARRAWRRTGSRDAITLTPAAGTALRLAPDARFEASGAIDAAAERLLSIFLPLLAAPRLAIGQLGQSLDGRIATASGRSHYISGLDGLLHLHRLRALVDAVVVGAGTIAADDPRLTVRHCPGENPVRVVIDRRRRLSADRRVFTDAAAPTLIICAPGGAAVPTHASPLPVAATDDGFDPRAILDALAARGLRRILIEGGGTTVSRFLAARALDALHLVVAPVILGSGRAGITLPEIDTLDAALRPGVRLHRLGDDMLYDLRLS